MTKAFKLSISCDSDNNYSVDWIQCDTFIIEDSSAKILNISDDEYIPTKGDKFYFLPGVSIPRVKLKDLTKDYGIKSTRNLQDATHIFAGRSTENKVTDRLWAYKIPTDAVQKLYDYLKENDFDGYYLTNLENALMYNEHEFVFLDYSAAGLFRNNPNSVFEEIREPEHVKALLKSSNYISTIEDDYVEDVLEIEKLGLPILDESALLKHINGEDATTIDEEVYGQLKTMFNSSDSDNHVLAMEIMANSNYIDSLMYIEILFKEFSYNMERCRTKNHVNFKGLLAFLGKHKSDMSTSLDDIVNSLRSNDILSIEKLNYLLGKYHDEISRHGDTSIFSVKTVTVNEDVLKELDYNYKYQIVSDYISENDNELFDETANLHALQHENCEDQNSEEIIENNTNEDTVDSLDVNEDTEEQIEVKNNSGDPLEANENNNEGGFDWF
jgi:hypothetical protein